MTRINARQRRREATYRRGYEDGKHDTLSAADATIGTQPCECTKVEQDETCPLGNPSLLCEVCGGKGHVPYVKLDGPELWEIVFGVNSDAATEITDAQYDQIAKHINEVFISPKQPAPSVAVKVFESDEPTIIASLEAHLDEYGRETVGQDIAAAILVIRDLHKQVALSAQVQDVAESENPSHDAYEAWLKRNGYPHTVARALAFEHGWRAHKKIAEAPAKQEGGK